MVVKRALQKRLLPTARSQQARDDMLHKKDFVDWKGTEILGDEKVPISRYRYIAAAVA